MRNLVKAGACAAALVVAACHGGDPQPTAAARRGSAVAAAVSPDVVARRRAMGRWRSRPHMLPGAPDRWLILDLAGSGDARVEIRSQGARGPAVAAFAVGRYQITPSGILGWTKGSEELAAFSWFHATFPSSAAMVLHSDRSGGGPVIEMTYDGA